MCLKLSSVMLKKGYVHLGFKPPEKDTLKKKILFIHQWKKFTQKTNKNMRLIRPSGGGTMTLVVRQLRNHLFFKCFTKMIYSLEGGGHFCSNK